MHKKSLEPAILFKIEQLSFIIIKGESEIQKLSISLI